jgi:hypothetical protein
MYISTHSPSFLVRGLDVHLWYAYKPSPVVLGWVVIKDQISYGECYTQRGDDSTLPLTKHTKDMVQTQDQNPKRIQAQKVI